MMIKYNSVRLPMIMGAVSLSMMFFSGCAPKKYAATEKIYKSKTKEFARLYCEIPKNQKLSDPEYDIQGEWIGAINFGIRKPNFVIIHHTAQGSVEQTVRTFHLERTGVSSHYVIGRDGEIIQMVHDLYRANHAGAGKWGNDTDLNSSSIGIELDNNGLTDPWPDVQIDALLRLLAQLKDKYKIPQANFLGHMDIAPTRKIDPSRFPWKKFAEHGFGYWYDDVHPPAPEGFDGLMALRVIGYDLKDPAAAVKAFKRHYIQLDNTAELTPYDLGILYQIFLKFK
jgi:N-acetylmuramoyl-L-alanine amidase